MQKKKNSDAKVRFIAYQIVNVLQNLISTQSICCFYNWIDFNISVADPDLEPRGVGGGGGFVVIFPAGFFSFCDSSFFFNPK